MKVAERMMILQPSGTISVMEKAERMVREGRRIFHLEIGEPDFGTPEHIKKAAYEALQGGFTHYTSSRGVLELREAISEDLKGRGIEAEPKNEIIVTPGAKHAIYCACHATLNPGDEVLVLSPAWPTYHTCAQAAGAKSIEVATAGDYRLDEEALKEEITDKTRMIVINSPNNPTGGVLSEEEIKSIADIAEDHNLWVLSDEIYDRLVYDGFVVKSVASFYGVRERTITVNGFSKAYAMTGWRLGYAVANKEVIEAMATMQQATTTCPASFVQKAAIAALNGPQDCVEKMVREYDERRANLVKKLNEISGISCAMPKGAFYAFPDLSILKMPSEEIADKLLVEEGVCSTAGSVFGRLGEGHIRLSYAASLQTILEAVERLKQFVERQAH
ncbi:MAG: Aspartate aminotransferase [Candidatus Bathyarchaeota archaeon BA1]|nr:MAG: Aspartate aminotransferase [Candidatus Bathyarchaeota archaeon BA1]